ncbi:23S rRNA (adenine(2503)-C(2))-methyltransferase RlmN [Candidatus Shapirobacteria bacterium]|nr:23S rRNA (adenine(2503)-C(2))-methyltransferase RlmN [Candidatus Shapirobacteria bacterium]
MNLPQVQAFLKESGQPDYRFRQISKNYFSGRYQSFLEMTDLPLNLRESLNTNSPLLSVTLDKIIDSPNTHKARLTLSDGKQIETVLMDYGSWSTVCVSSQVGCALGCTFCATGKMGFTRNLTPEEIVDQIIFWKYYLHKSKVGASLAEAHEGGLRIVFMGMGEPFLNFDNFVSATTIINSPEGLNIGQRKMSVSTAGVVPGIKKFMELDTQINLAISLHSADQATRAQMMPIARQYTLDELIPAIKDYADKTNRQVFFEYLLAKNINDTPFHLDLLIDLMSQHKLFYLNLIPLNPIKGGLTPSAQSTLNNFETELTRHHINYSIRQSLGQSAASACGQLIVEK